MRKLFVIGFALSLCACVQGDKFYLEADTDTYLFNNLDPRTPIVVMPATQNIFDKNAASQFSDTLRYMGLPVANARQFRKEPEFPFLMFLFAFDNDYVNTQVELPVYGQTGISSIDTKSNTSGNINGTIYTPGAYSGKNYTYDGQLSSTTNTTSKVNYNYGITGYKNTTVQTEYSTLQITIYYITDKKFKREMVANYVITAVDSSSNYLLSYMPFILPEIFGVNTNDDSYQISCADVSSKNGGYETQCQLNGAASIPRNNGGGRQLGMAFLGLLGASANSTGGY
ncbi:hypothetical protein AGMMS50222_03920 [Endomicrobiia bacterium]|nr:hypothetical protein AGMMS50222_03920 [Endomicrobiia bacterium]